MASPRREFLEEKPLPQQECVFNDVIQQIEKIKKNNQLAALLFDVGEELSDLEANTKSMDIDDEESSRLTTENATINKFIHKTKRMVEYLLDTANTTFEVETVISCYYYDYFMFFMPLTSKEESIKRFCPAICNAAIDLLPCVQEQDQNNYSSYFKKACDVLENATELKNALESYWVELVGDVTNGRVSEAELIDIGKYANKLAIAFTSPGYSTEARLAAVDNFYDATSQQNSARVGGAILAFTLLGLAAGLVMVYCPPLAILAALVWTKQLAAVVALTMGGTLVGLTVTGIANCMGATFFHKPYYHKDQINQVVKTADQLLARDVNLPLKLLQPR